MSRWFGFDAFRPVPTDDDGRPLQERIVDEGMCGKSVLGITAIACFFSLLTMSSANVPDLIEWFGEWARDARGEQRGLLLMTAHRAKGLEFDDVVILNGGWDHPSDNEDADAPRRLFYVAMTRARRSLAVMTQGAHAYVPAAGVNILRRDVAALGLRELPPERHYILPELGQVFIDWAGRLPARDRSVQAIAQTQVGAPVTISKMHERWFVKDMQGRRLSAMRGDWALPSGRRIVSAQVGAIVTRHAHESGEAHRTKLNREHWEVVLPEIVLE